MIGQKNNIEIIKKWRMNRSVPRFILIIGDKGSGRLTLAKYISRAIGTQTVIMGNTVEQVRETISNAYNVQEPTCYIFQNADLMSLQAKNALLKVTEEPPNKAYIIMTLESENNTLPTILSRATSLKMQDYSQLELEQVCDNVEMVRHLKNIGQIKEWQERGDFEQFLEFCVLTANNLEWATESNALKITNRIKLKADGEGYDAKTFISITGKMLMMKAGTFKQYEEMCAINGKALARLGYSSMKKESIIDTWILEMKEVLDNGVSQ